MTPMAPSDPDAPDGPNSNPGGPTPGGHIQQKILNQSNIPPMVPQIGLTPMPPRCPESV